MRFPVVFVVTVAAAAPLVACAAASHGSRASAATEPSPAPAPPAPPATAAHESAAHESATEPPARALDVGDPPRLTGDRDRAAVVRFTRLSLAPWLRRACAQLARAADDEQTAPPTAASVRRAVDVAEGFARVTAAAARALADALDFDDPALRAQIDRDMRGAMADVVAPRFDACARIATRAGATAIASSCAREAAALGALRDERIAARARMFAALPPWSATTRSAPCVLAGDAYFARAEPVYASSGDAAPIGRLTDGARVHVRALDLTGARRRLTIDAPIEATLWIGDDAPLFEAARDLARSEAVTVLRGAPARLGPLVDGHARLRPTFEETPWSLLPEAIGDGVDVTCADVVLAGARAFEGGTPKLHEPDSGEWLSPAPSSDVWGDAARTRRIGLAQPELALRVLAREGDMARVRAEEDGVRVDGWVRIATTEPIARGGSTALVGSPAPTRPLARVVRATALLDAPTAKGRAVATLPVGRFVEVDPEPARGGFAAVHDPSIAAAQPGAPLWVRDAAIERVGAP